MGNPEYIRPPLGMEADDSYGLVLTTHMAALAAVVASAREDVLPQDRSRILSVSPRPGTGPLACIAWAARRPAAYFTRRNEYRPVYTATLTGPLSHQDGLAVLQHAQVESSEHPGQLIRDHALCYPPQEADIVLEPLYPDRLGEDFLAREFLDIKHYLPG